MILAVYRRRTIHPVPPVLFFFSKPVFGGILKLRH